MALSLAELRWNVPVEETEAYQRALRALPNKVPINFVSDRPFYECDLTPRPRQVDGIAWLRSGKRRLLWDVPGIGKTLQAVLAAVPPVYISAPTYAAAKFEQWLRAHMGPEVTDHIYLATGRNMDRLTRTEVLLAAHADPLAWVIGNHEMLRPEVIEHETAGKIIKSAKPNPEKGGGWLYEYPIPPVLTAILDEMHWLRGRNAWKSRGAKALFQDTPYVYGLTATPIYKDGDDLYQQLAITRPWAYPSYNGFVKMFLKTYSDGWSRKIAGFRDFQALMHTLRNVAIARDYEPGELPEFFELDPFVIEPTAVTKARLRNLKDNYRDGSAIYTSAAQVINAVDRIAAESQEKLEALSDFINDNGRRYDGSQRGVLVFTWLRESALIVKKHLERTTGRFYALIDGDVPPEKRPYIAEHSDNVVATLASMSESVDCSHMSLVSVFEEYHTFGPDYQGVRRALRQRHSDHPRYDARYAAEPVLLARFILKHSADQAKHNNVVRRTGNATMVMHEMLAERD